MTQELGTHPFPGLLLLSFHVCISVCSASNLACLSADFRGEGAAWSVVITLLENVKVLWNLIFVCICRFRTVRARPPFTRRLALGAWTASVPWWPMGLMSSKCLCLLFPAKDGSQRVLCSETVCRASKSPELCFCISNTIFHF